MASKTCKVCGYTVDREKRTRTCPTCRTVFDENYCICCGCYCTPPDLIKGSYCRDCYDTLVRQPDAKKKSYGKWSNEIISIFDDWMSKVDKVPHSYPSLTEEQWLQACRYFGGCARCGNDDISVRGYFVPFIMGGRYCDWNVIPVCEDCSMSVQQVDTRTDINPFKALARKDPEAFYNILNYLGDKLNAAANIKEDQ
jgi:hypothetical protein